MPSQRLPPCIICGATILPGHMHQCQLTTTNNPLMAHQNTAGPSFTSNHQSYQAQIQASYVHTSPTQSFVAPQQPYQQGRLNHHPSYNPSYDPYTYGPPQGALPPPPPSPPPRRPHSPVSYTSDSAPSTRGSNTSGETRIWVRGGPSSGGDTGSRRSGGSSKKKGKDLYITWKTPSDGGKKQYYWNR